MGGKQFCPVCKQQAGCGTFLCKGCQPSRWVHPKCGGYNKSQVQAAGRNGVESSLRCNICKQSASLKVDDARSSLSPTTTEAKRTHSDVKVPVSPSPPKATANQFEDNANCSLSSSPVKPKRKRSDVCLKCPVCNQRVGSGAFMCFSCQPNKWVHPKCGGYSIKEVQIAGKAGAGNKLTCSNCKRTSMDGTPKTIALSPAITKITHSDVPCKCPVATKQTTETGSNTRPVVSPYPCKARINNKDINSQVSTSPSKVKVDHSDITEKGTVSKSPKNLKPSHSDSNERCSMSVSRSHVEPNQSIMDIVKCKVKEKQSDADSNCSLSSSSAKAKRKRSDVCLKCPVCNQRVGSGAFMCFSCQPNKWVHPKCGGYSIKEVQIAGKAGDGNKLTCSNCKEGSSCAIAKMEEKEENAIQPYFCVKCRERFLSYGKMISHSKNCMVKYKKEESEHREGFPDRVSVSEVYSCDQCDQRFHHYKDLMEHKKSCTVEQDSEEGSDETDTDDDVCFNDKLRNEIYELIHKSITMNKQRRLGIGEKVFWCPPNRVDIESANQGTDTSRQDKHSKTTEAQHDKNSGDKTRCKCDECGKSYSRIDTLNLHKKLHHNTINRKSLSHPRKLHTKIVPSRKVFCCQICKKCFRHRGNYNLHKESHRRGQSTKYTRDKLVIKPLKNTEMNMKPDSGAKSHRCDQCGKCCINNTELQAHLRVHTGEKPFRCNICGKSFIRKHHLTDHINGVHLKLRPYGCNFCQKLFFRSTPLYVHIQIHHAGGISDKRPYRCNICGECFSSKNVFTAHVKKHRGSENSKKDGPLRVRKRNPQV